MSRKDEEQRRPDRDAEVEPEAHAVDVVKVIIELATDGPQVGIGRLEYLGQARQSGPDREPLVVVRQGMFELGDDLGPLRTGSDQAHLAPTYVDKLGKLIEMTPPQETPDRSDACVSGNAPLRPVDLALQVHRADLEDRERLAIQPQPLLGVDCGPTRCERTRNKQRRIRGERTTSSRFARMLSMRAFSCS